MYISKKIDTSLFEFLKEKFSIFGYLINIILILTTMYLVFIFSWSFLDFVIGQFLTRTSYYFVSISLFIFVFYCVKKDIEVIEKARKTKSLDRILEIEIPANIYEELIELIK